MRLIRFGDRGHERPGLWSDDGVIDLKAIFPQIPDIGESFFRDNWLTKVQSVKETPVPLDVRLGCPLHQPSKIICLGINYAAHGQEGKFEKPPRPLLFTKTPNALNGPFDPIRLPGSSQQVDWEVELAVVIGREGRGINKADAFDYVAGFTVMNDVSARDVQFSESQWYRGKSFDTFAPLGPAIVTLDEIGEIKKLQNLRLTTKVNGQLMQDGNTSDMVFNVSEIIEDISHDITLVPGDVISTGTPAGVGIFRDPPVLLNPGDEVACQIERIGTICNQVVAAQPVNASR